MNELNLWDGMAIKGQTRLLLVAFFLLIAATALSISHQVNTLSYLRQDYLDAEERVSNLMKEWEALAFEQWILLKLGTYPRNASGLGLSGGVRVFVFYSNDTSEENLKSTFDPLAQSFNITIAYLGLVNQTNLNTLKDMWNRTGFAEEPNAWQSYVIFLNSSKIICLRLEQVGNEAFNKCMEYLSLPTRET